MTIIIVLNEIHHLKIIHAATKAARMIINQLRRISNKSFFTVSFTSKKSN